jgi:hypothetical protein
LHFIFNALGMAPVVHGLLRQRGDLKQGGRTDHDDLQWRCSNGRHDTAMMAIANSGPGAGVARACGTKRTFDIIATITLAKGHRGKAVG